MPLGAVKENVECLCQDYRNGQRIREEKQAVLIEKQRAQNLWYERGNNDNGRRVSITRNLGCGHHQHRLP